MSREIYCIDLQFAIKGEFLAGRMIARHDEQSISTILYGSTATMNCGASLKTVRRLFP